MPASACPRPWKATASCQPPLLSSSRYVVRRTEKRSSSHAARKYPHVGRNWKSPRRSVHVGRSPARWAAGSSHSAPSACNHKETGMKRKCTTFSST
eukprot:7016939-Pyramimonas_sp.AAC.1